MPISGTIDAERSYIPALGKRWLLPLYDPFLWLLGADKAKRPLIEKAEIKPRFRVLDIGCGTGSMAVLIKRMRPAAEVVGIDPDPSALSVAERKTKRARCREFDRGFADSFLPVLDKMMGSGLITVEKVQVLQYGDGKSKT